MQRSTPVPCSWKDVRLLSGSVVYSAGSSCDYSAFESHTNSRNQDLSHHHRRCLSCKCNLSTTARTSMDDLVVSRINGLLDEADELPLSTAKLGLLEEAVQLVDSHQNVPLGIRGRYELMSVARNLLR